MGWKKIDIACCLCLKKEGTILARILESRDFEVKGIFCKTGSVPKEFLGIARDKMLKKEGFEAMCNPIAQAVLLGKEKTELNVIMGLYMGHDILFLKHSKAPTTTLVVKDRILCHNTVVATYGSDGFYKRLYRKDQKKT